MEDFPREVRTRISRRGYKTAGKAERLLREPGGLARLERSLQVLSSSLPLFPSSSLTLLHFYTFTLLHFCTFTLLHFYTFTLLHLHTLTLLLFKGRAGAAVLRLQRLMSEAVRTTTPAQLHWMLLMICKGAVEQSASRWRQRRSRRLDAS